MNSIKDELTRLERGRVASISAGPDGLKARIDAQLVRAGDDDRTDSVVVWNGMVARFLARHQRSSASLAHDRATDGGFLAGMRLANATISSHAAREGVTW